MLNQIIQNNLIQLNQNDLTLLNSNLNPQAQALQLYQYILQLNQLNSINSQSQNK